MQSKSACVHHVEEKMKQALRRVSATLTAGSWAVRSNHALNWQWACDGFMVGFVSRRIDSIESAWQHSGNILKCTGEAVLILGVCLCLVACWPFFNSLCPSRQVKLPITERPLLECFVDQPGIQCDFMFISH